MGPKGAHLGYFDYMQLYLALGVELRGVYRKYFDENWPDHIGTALSLFKETYVFKSTLAAVLVTWVRSITCVPDVVFRPTHVNHSPSVNMGVVSISNKSHRQIS